MIKNTFFILLGRVFQVGAYFLAIIFIARYFSIEEFGDFSFINAFVASVMAISFFGAGKMLTRETSRNKSMAAQYTGIALTIRAFLMLISAAFVLFSAAYWHLSMPMFLAMVLAIAVNIFQGYTQLLLNLFQAFERMKYEPVVILVSSVALLLGIVVVILMDLGFLAIFMATALSGLIRSGLATIVLIRNFVVPRFDFKKKEIVRFIKKSIIVGIGIFLYYSLFRVDVLLLKWLRGVEDVAYFQGVHHIILRMEMLPMAIMAAIFPRISRFAVGDTENLATTYERAFNYMFVVGLLVSILLFCYSEQIVTGLLGEKFLPSVISLKVLSWSVVALFMDVVMNNMLIATEKQRITVFLGAFALMVNVVVGLLFIPHFGQLGAAVAGLLSYMTLFVMSYIYLFVSGSRLSLWHFVFKPVLAGAVAMATIEATKGLSLPGSFLMGGSAYVLLLWKLEVLTKKEIRNILGKIASRSSFADKT